MPTLPWTPITAIDPSTDYLVMATRFVVTSRWRTPEVVRATQTLWDTLPATGGLFGYSLRASIGQQTLSTLTAWRDRDSLNAFVRGDPHLAVIRRTRQWMTDSHFASWTAAGLDLPPNWSTVLNQLATH